MSWIQVRTTTLGKAVWAYEGEIISEVRPAEPFSEERVSFPGPLNYIPPGGGFQGLTTVRFPGPLNYIPRAMVPGEGEAGA